jgi:predicted ABC-type ATPase
VHEHSQSSNPAAILIAGPNGAGKTTFAREMIPFLHPGVPFLNADEIQLESLAFRSHSAAAKELLRRLDLAERSTASFAVETTLASSNYLPRVRRWSAAGFRTVLHFIELPSADFAVERVRARVTAGGHDIPEIDIRRRFTRGKKLFLAVYKETFDVWYHWFSDDDGLRLLQKHPSG